MSTAKKYTAREVKTILQKNGFVRERTNGSHVIYKDKNKREISIPCGREPNKMLVRRLIKENNLIVR